ncbi:MAG: DNA polymerase IV [Oscillospiraceae bacterium]|jgi:DNA polymerase-4|nr:DNA polymerase IV [Oscillospiraceae bacterium]
MPDRAILHCDCNAFYASVEETFSPELRKVPMAIAGDPARRHGIILAKNELAKQFGIKTAETVWSAKIKCPHLTLAPPRHDAYASFSDRVNAIYEQYTPRVERFGIDESFLDVTGCPRNIGGDGALCADEIRMRVRSEIGITISVGVSWNKIFAKLGSDYKKPDAVTVISRENWKDIVFPLPVGDLFFVGKKTVEALAKHGIATIGQLASCDRAWLNSRFGKSGDTLYINANGLDDSPVAETGRFEPAKSIGNGFTFRRDLVSNEDIRAGVIFLSDTVAGRLRRNGLKCATVSVALKDNAMKSITRQTKLPAPAYLSGSVAEAALALIAKHWPKGKPIRTLTITAENLVRADQCPQAEQLSLLDDPTQPKTDRAERLEKAIDDIRGRFGEYALQPAIIIGSDIGVWEAEPRGDTPKSKEE